MPFIMAIIWGCMVLTSCKVDIMVTCEKYSPNMSYEWDKFVQSSRTPLFFHKFERSFVDYHANRFEDSSLILTDDLWHNSSHACQ